MTITTVLYLNNSFTIEDDKFNEFKLLHNYININEINNVTETIYNEIHHVINNKVKLGVSTLKNDINLCKKYGMNFGMYDGYSSIYEREKQRRYNGINETSLICFSDIVNENFKENIPYTISGKLTVTKNNKQKEFDEKFGFGNKLTTTEIFNEIKRILPQEVKEHLVIAGGSVDKHIKNLVLGKSDIDFFIYGLSQEHGNILVKFVHKQLTTNFIMKTYDSKIYINDNVTFFDIYVGSQKIKFQFINRLYESKDQIVHGFDVDSSCLLVDLLIDDLNKSIFMTERCAYSYVNNINTVNFDRMSPSYIYRLIKYANRGINIYLPLEDIYFDNKIYDFSETVHNAQLLMKYEFSNTLINNNISDYYEGNNYTEFNENDTITFKVLNPDEQSVGSFHKIILENPREFYGYPKKEFSSEYTDKTIITIQQDEEYGVIYDRNEEEDIEYITNNGFYSTRLHNIKYKNLMSSKKYKANRLPDRTSMNDFLEMYNGTVCISGLTVLSIYDEIKYKSSINFHLINCKNKALTAMSIADRFFSFYLYHMIPKILGFNYWKDINSSNFITDTMFEKDLILNDDNIEVKWNIEKFDDIDDKIMTLLRYIPKIVIHMKNHENVNSVLDSLDYVTDYSKLLLIHSNTNKIGKFVMFNRDYNAIKNRVHYSSKLNSYEEIAYNIPGYRVIIDSEEDKEMEIITNINIPTLMRQSDGYSVLKQSEINEHLFMSKSSNSLKVPTTTFD